MITPLRPRTLVLFVGDIFAFVAALWLALYLRTFEVPSQALFLAHLVPFCLLFVAWAAIFFIAGLYESRLLAFARRELTATLLGAQLANMVIAALFFFFIPLFGIAPKTLLVIYLVTSFLLVLLWRAVLYPQMRREREKAIVVGEGSEINELVEALRRARRGPVSVAAVIAPGPEFAAVVRAAMREHQPRFVIAHWGDARVSRAFPELTELLTRGVRFLDAMALYEEVFGRVPLSVLDDEWLARNISRYAHTLYDPLKRSMDIVVGLVAGVLSLAAYPFIALAIKLEDGGPVFVALMRVGERGRVLKMRKFRSMTGNDQGNYGPGGKTTLSVTRVGKVLRDSRLDELPQLWNVVLGDFSLIGPRPEAPALVEVYEREIPYYGVRHLIKPGLSGWAQLYHDNHPHHGTDVDATREKLSYDLYYLKHRSLMLDGAVALKTIKKLLTRSGV